MSFVLSAIKRGTKSKMSDNLEGAAAAAAAADTSNNGSEGDDNGEQLDAPAEDQAAAATDFVDPRQAEWDIMVRLLELDEDGLNALTEAGILSMDDVELFGTGAAKEATAGPILIAKLSPMTRQKFQIVATFLLNNGKLVAESSALAQMARFNLQASKRKAGRPRKKPLVDSNGEPIPKRPRGRPRKNPLVTTYKKPDGIKRPVGRPRKHPLVDSNGDPIPKRARGRPRKDSVGPTVTSSPAVMTTPNGTKRSVGRPRKHSLPMAAAAASAEEDDPKRTLQRSRTIPDDAKKESEEEEEEESEEEEEEEDESAEE